jgi:hypothetical protein
LADRMRQVASGAESARSKGSAAARAIRASWTWDHAAAAAKARLRELAGCGSA